ncbi:Yip1 domain-containing protein [Gemmatirosa kalamazoonensis]|jgi:hypothetical protein|uniref:Yip1 domain-containing protein n=1 Tax=Gemmatirosa kalamazoonensis TaxID=861299 RepID=W0RFJ7_9BACT|nr:YIP1 family protein [Gemmatirosa kalamazoonensis]AHG89182.1 Yip1 domain-containing protein [Gemmatirosa kalamazoonensis]
MAEFGSSRSIVDRMRGAAALDVATYEEVEADVNATGQAAIVVVIAAIAAGIGAWRFGPGHIIGSVVSELLGWASWAAITYWIGTRFFGGTATWGELARTLGFARSPGVLFVLGIIPGLGLLVWPIVGIWILVAGIIAIRQALDIDTGKAVLVALCGWAVNFIIHWLLSGLR